MDILLDVQQRLTKATSLLGNVTSHRRDLLSCCSDMLACLFEADKCIREAITLSCHLWPQYDDVQRLKLLSGLPNMFVGHFNRTLEDIKSQITCAIRAAASDTS